MVTFDVGVSDALDEEDEPNVREDTKTSLPAWTGFPTASGADLIDEQLGPALMWLRALVVAMVIMQAAFFVLVKLTAVCPEDGDAPTYPWWAWAVSIPCLLLRNYVEWRSLGHFLPCYVKNVRKAGLKPFKVLGVGVPFLAWAAVYVPYSNLNFCDVGTDSLFTVIVVKSEECPGNRMAEVWRSTLQQSVFGGLGVQRVALSSVVTATWLISFLQMIYPLIQTVGRGCCKQEELGEIGLDTGLLSCAPMCNKEKFADLSEAAGLATVRSVSITSTHASSCKGPGELDNPFTVVDYAAGVVRQLLLRFVFTYILENALQLNVQTTVFAIQRSLTKGAITLSQKQTLGSIGITIMLTFLKLAEAKSCFDFTRLVDRALADYEPAAVDRALADDYRALLRQYRRRKWGIAAASFVLVLALAYATCKLVAAFVCEGAMFNLTGCVDV